MRRLKCSSGLRAIILNVKNARRFSFSLLNIRVAKPNRSGGPLKPASLLKKESIMSKTVNVLIAVDTSAAQSSKNLSGNVYMVDTNHFMGSTAEGQPELVTVLHNGDTVVWNVQPINPGNDVEISGFT